MGTYYRITCNCEEPERIQNSVDSLLGAINLSLSTYIDSSYISEINHIDQDSIIVISDQHFIYNLDRALEWYQKSDGFLDVSVMPLVNYWGFGYADAKLVSPSDTILIDSILAYTGLDKWSWNKNELIKTDSRQQLDFSSIAKGYAVDEIAKLLRKNAIDRFLIDIGGELMTSGLNARGKQWTVGISAPKSEADITEVQLLLQLTDKALASSGNYRNFRVQDGVKYGHTINPKEGFPYQDRLLSASIVTDHCIDADAIATACMAMGYSKATTFIKNLSDVSACFLIGGEDGTIQTKYINGFIQYVISE